MISSLITEEEQEEDVGVGGGENQKGVRRDIRHHRPRRKSAPAPQAQFHIQRKLG